MIDNINEINNTMKNNNETLRTEINNKIDTMQVLNDATRIEMLEIFDQRSRFPSRASVKALTRAVGSRQLTASLTATIPVTIAPIIVPVLKTPSLYSMVTDIESSPTPIEPIQFLTDITIKEIVQPFEIVIGAPVRTNVSQYDITRPAGSNYPFQDIPKGDNLSMVVETLNPYYSDDQVLRVNNFAA
jgi:hypothetical protein